MIKAVIFDFDGLILDTETAWYESYKAILKEYHNFDLPLEEFVKCVGSDDVSITNYLRQKLGTELDLELIDEKAKASHTIKMKHIKARDGVESCLQDAYKAGLKIALATSSSLEWATSHLSNLNLMSYFDHFITRDIVKRVKPAPDLYLKAIDMLDINPSEAIVFEDSLNGLIAAQKANLKTIIIPNPVTKVLPFENYHLKLDSMEDMSLKEIIASIH